MKHFEHANRSVVKTITYRVLIILATLVVVYLSTGNIDTTVDITIMSSVVNTILYFVHERVWNNIHWGKQGKKS